MNTFIRRAITGLSFAAIMAISILLSPWSFIGILFLIATLGLIEFYRLVKSDHTEPQVITGVVISQLLILLLAWIQCNHSTGDLLFISIPLVALIFFIELYRKKEHPFQNIALTITGIIYLCLPVLLMIKIAFGFTPADDDPYHGEIIMGCILLIWANDTGAYMIGSKIGKHRLFERISPKKSWEGFMGGLVVAIFASWVVSKWFPDLLFSEWLIIAIIIVTTGTLGDLVESMLKRSVNVKDSGTLLPGHGGILDRFDALLLSIPFVFFYLLLMGKF